MTVTPGHVLLLIGTSSAGTSMTAAALRERLDEYQVIVGCDPL